LKRDRAPGGIDELWQKCQEKQRRFRVQQIDDETVAVQPAQASPRQLQWRGNAKNRGQAGNAALLDAALGMTMSMQGYSRPLMFFRYSAKPST
jgi:hypothetical protein